MRICCTCGGRIVAIARTTRAQSYSLPKLVFTAKWLCVPACIGLSAQSIVCAYIASHIVVFIRRTQQSRNFPLLRQYCSNNNIIDRRHCELLQTVNNHYHYSPRLTKRTSTFFSLLVFFFVRRKSFLIFV